jgi:hypothetical protein
MTNVRTSSCFFSNRGTDTCGFELRPSTTHRQIARASLSNLLVLLCCAFMGNLFGATTLTVGTNINITRSAANNSETCISINPLNPNQLFTSETWSLATKYSTNADATWQNSNISALGNSLGGDVTSAWDSFGNLFLVEFGANLTIVVGVSTNAGATFRLVYTTSASNNDQPTVVVGPSGTPGQGSVWILYTDSSNRPTVQGARVSGLGNIGAFSSPQNAPGPGGSFGDIVIGPNGQVMVTYQNNGSGIGPDTIKVNVDPDGLGPAPFGPVIIASSTQVGGFAPLPAQPNRTIDTEVGLAWDRSGGPHNGRVYMMYTDRPSTSSADTDIYVRYSDDQGTNWSSRIRVNDDPVGNGKSQFLPKLALDQTSGNIAVCFYDCRNSPGNTQAEFWATASTDGGLTFAPNVKVSAGMSDGTVAAAQGFDFGDYTGIAFHAGSFYPCWADNSNSTGDNPAGVHNALDMYTARVSLANPPQIVSLLPTNLTVLLNQPASFTVTATGPNLAYQWRKNGSALSGATTSVYSLASAQLNDSGSYQVVVTNISGSVTSGVASLTVVATVPLAVALDNASLTWTTNPATPWFGQTNVFHVGGTNGASGRNYPIVDNQQSTLTTTATGPGVLSFWWKVSSQPGADSLKFISFGGGLTNSAQISGEVDWTQQVYFLAAGPQTLQWTYSKDASGSAGDDAGYVDQVTYQAGAFPPSISTQPLSQGALAGRPVSFSVVAGGTPVLAYQWRFNGNALLGATSSTLTITNPTPLNVGTYAVQITNIYGLILSSNASLGFIPMAVAGDNSLGQLDLPGTVTNAVAIAAGAWHNLALKADGSVVGWGENYDGQCNVPAGLIDAVAIAAGGYHSLAIQSNGTVLAWGANYNNQTNVPPGLSNVIAIAAGTWHSLALRGDGTVIAWGDDSFGQTDVPTGLTGVTAIAAGGNHNLALRGNGTVIAWGENTDANGNYAGQSVVPLGLANVAAIGAGAYHSLAAKTDGTVVAWGANADGQSSPPASATGVAQLAGGGAHSIALRADSTIKAWGNNWYGQCNFPPGLSNVVAIAAGDSHSIALVGSPVLPPVLLNPSLQGTVFSVSVQTLNGKHYVLEYKTSLSSTTWTALAPVPGDGSLQVLTDPNATGPQRFYRVQQY